MTLTRRDGVATSLTALAVLAFVATHEAWDVPLIGDNRRWAAAVIIVLGIGACAAGANGATSAMFGVLGTIALALSVLAVATGSLTPLSLLVADLVVMWALATLRHVHGPPRRPIAT
jgi:hypothetical protein